MSKIYDFIRECGVFYLLTIDGDFPVGRPFGVIMEYNEKLYLSTGIMKRVYKQIKCNNNVSIVALKTGTRSWIRVRGKAKECLNIDIKKRMIKEYPVLTKHFESESCKEFALIEIEVIEYFINTGDL